jgi:hypothetical protein
MTNEAYKDELNAAAARGTAKRERLNMHASDAALTEADTADMKQKVQASQGRCKACGAQEKNDHMAGCPLGPSLVSQPAGLYAMLNERGNHYGKFVDHAETTQEIKAALYRRLRCKTIKADQIEALEMIAHKMGRIVCGDPDYEDSWRGIAGYATLVADRLKGEER